MRNWKNERGSSLVVSLLAVTLLSALGAALVMTSNTELMLSRNYEHAQQTLYAADAGVERSVQDLIRQANWSNILAGALVSGFIDTAPYRLPDGTSADLTAMTNALQSDSDAHFGGSTPNRPVWQLYAYGPVADLLPAGVVDNNGWVAIWVGDDQGETDNDPAIDGNGGVLLHAEAYGKGGSRKVVEASIVRASTTTLERGYVAQRGQDEQNRRARKEAVQTPGASLTEMIMTLAVGGIS